MCTKSFCPLLLSSLLLTTAIGLDAQAPADTTGGDPIVTSPQILPDRRVIVRIFAPQARQVTVNGIVTPAPNLSKKEKGVWEATIGPVDPGTYRYRFMVDGTATLDPRNIEMERMQIQTRSILHVPGTAWMDTRDVPHGTVGVVNYYSKSLSQFRRMHVYTPPGYENNQQKYPVFYLHHGGNESDDSWWTVGRAGFILDNLIAEGKAVPMIVVMPNGHTNFTPSAERLAATRDGAVDPYPEDFVTAILPYVESHYRVIADRPHRAIAGLSMGGGQTLHLGFSHLDWFSAIGIFSSGIGAGRNDEWEKAHLAQLDNAKLKSGLKTLWFSTGSNDPILPRSKGTIELLKKHGFNPSFTESTGEHTWINWRNYLHEFAPLLFR